MKKINRQNGFILMLVIVMIPLIGMVLAIVSANSKTLMIQTRSGELHLRAQNACQSGLAWAKLNRSQLWKLDAEKPLTLMIGDSHTKNTCSIVRQRQDNTEEIFEITGRAEERGFIAKHTEILRIKER
jgi:hypothetical protein